MSQLIKKAFNNYQVEYGITNPSGRDLVRIDFLLGVQKAGQALFGNAVTPGSFAAIGNNGEIDLFFPLSHFPNIIELLKTLSGLSLFAEVEDIGQAHVNRGGIIKNA